jgi:eukaryotic-like serine/threonine-protein kinase
MTTSSDICGQSPELKAGDLIGEKYLLLDALAVGGMGRIWTARNLATGAEVAVKVLLPEHSASPGSVARFRREAQATAALSHRAIVRVFDLIALDPGGGPLVMVMELLRGRTLAYHIEEMGRLSVDDTLGIVFPLLSALAHAHGRGIVHRDLKPENVLLALEPDGQLMPKLVDFGISRQLRASPITLDGQIVGTLGYMSPEQTLGVDVDARTDIFSLGILMYECLSGRRPYDSPKDGTASTLMSVFELQPRPLTDIPARLWEVIRRALATNAEERFASVDELAEALAKVASPSPFALRRSSIMPAPLLAPASIAGAFPAAQKLVQRIALVATLASVAIISAASAERGARPLDASASRLAPLAISHEKRLAVSIDTLGSVASSVAVTVPPPASSPSARAAGVRRADPFAIGASRPFRSHSTRGALSMAGPHGLVRDPGF